VVVCAIQAELLFSPAIPTRRNGCLWPFVAISLLMACRPTDVRHPFPDGSALRYERVESYPLGYPAFALAVEQVAGGHSPHFNYSLAVASYQMMQAHKIPLNEDSIIRSVKYVVLAREIAGSRLLFGKGTRIINILHEYDSFNNLFAAGAIVRKEIGLGARAQDIWTFQGPAEIASALKVIANSKGPTTIYIYAHGIGQSIRLSDIESLELSDLARAMKQRGGGWVNVLADECDGVVTYLPSVLREIGAEVPSYILSSTPRGGVTRGSQLLNAISGSGNGSGTYFVDPRKLELEDLAMSQDFVLLWTPTLGQRSELKRVWPFPNQRIDVQDDAVYPAWVWELANNSEKNHRAVVCRNGSAA
jgi:hypothetical protein